MNAVMFSAFVAPTTLCLAIAPTASAQGLAGSAPPTAEARLKDAFAACQDGDYDIAIPAIQTIVKETGGLGARLALGDCLKLKGDLVRALDVYKAIVHDAPLVAARSDDPDVKSAAIARGAQAELRIKTLKRRLRELFDGPHIDLFPVVRENDAFIYSAPHGRLIGMMIMGAGAAAMTAGAGFGVSAILRRRASEELGHCHDAAGSDGKNQCDPYGYAERSSAATSGDIATAFLISGAAGFMGGALTAILWRGDHRPAPRAALNIRPTGLNLTLTF